MTERPKYVPVALSTSKGYPVWLVLNTKTSIYESATFEGQTCAQAVQMAIASDIPIMEDEAFHHLKMVKNYRNMFEVVDEIKQKYESVCTENL